VRCEFGSETIVEAVESVLTARHECADLHRRSIDGLNNLQFIDSEHMPQGVHSYALLGECAFSLISRHS
jgi:hypothetical protein